MKELRFRIKKQHKIILWKGLKPIIVNVKNYLDNIDVLTLNVLCLDEFNKEVDKKLDLDRYVFFGNVKPTFDMYILEKCTDLNFRYGNAEQFANSKLMYKIKKNILNYEEIWNVVVKSIELKNMYVSLNLIRDIIPNTEKMEDNIKNIVAIINELNDKNPQLFKKIVESNLINNEIDKANKEWRENKKNNAN